MAAELWLSDLGGIVSWMQWTGSVPFRRLQGILETEADEVYNSLVAAHIDQK